MVEGVGRALTQAKGNNKLLYAIVLQCVNQRTKGKGTHKAQACPQGK